MNADMHSKQSKEKERIETLHVSVAWGLYFHFEALGQWVYVDEFMGSPSIQFGVIFATRNSILNRGWSGPPASHSCTLLLYWVCWI